MSKNLDFYESLDSTNLRQLLEIAEKFEPENILNQQVQIYERALLVAQANLNRAKRAIELRAQIRAIYNNKLKQET
jgi:hypothetical protein